ncbi:Sugar lactone lactonase YvrE [Duganella sacchari]|uniref:Sugar lactone lactonase YvrE n=1 Tax=Duganella sacchari TaxID=551987 RepID=A0A1M7LJY7_9BURK|nr:SMP-30/gluconolactonase/LRE family protein [Duganella sacchari]SHM78336.1 Sugar lactone lactonase YvrE [Duganella sacchari]
MRCMMVVLLSAGLNWSAPSMAEELYVATALTAERSFTAGIEGPAVDAAGNIYAVNFGRQQTIGIVTPQGAGRVFAQLPGASVPNGLRFDRQGALYVADYVGHNVFRIAPGSSLPQLYAHEAKMTQPNDLAMTADGVLYASDPDWEHNTGRVWRIDTDGKVSLAADGMGTTNGIDLSPDGRTLYVNESVQKLIWAFTVGAGGALTDKRLLHRFEDFGMDGMRVDVDGNLYVSRFGKGTIAKLSPGGVLLQEIRLPGARPSNLCFGGPDGRTVYVTEVEHQRLLQFRVDRPGLEWQRIQGRQ